MTAKTEQLVGDAMRDPDRSKTIAAIRAALQERSGKAWSVTGGRGTAYGWITITAPPARRAEFGSMTEADQAELSALLGKKVHNQGESVPAASDYRRVAIQQAATGSPNGQSANQYWD